MKGEILRTIRTKRFEVTIEAHEEHLAPEDTIALSDAENEEYCDKIRSGEYPWYCLGVHVRTLPLSGRVYGVELGASYLGCVDTYDLHSIGLRDMVSLAVADTRATLILGALPERERSWNGLRAD